MTYSEFKQYYFLQLGSTESKKVPCQLLRYLKKNLFYRTIKKDQTGGRKSRVTADRTSPAACTIPSSY